MATIFFVERDMVEIVMINHRNQFELLPSLYVVVIGAVIVGFSFGQYSLELIITKNEKEKE